MPALNRGPGRTKQGGRRMTSKPRPTDPCNAEAVMRKPVGRLGPRFDPILRKPSLKRLIADFTTGDEGTLWVTRTHCRAISKSGWTCLTKMDPSLER
jgi:hypothetical protein